MKCPKCGYEITERDTVCPNCKRVLKVVCPKCKRIVSVVSPCKNEKCDGVFCCGEKMQSLSSLTDKAGKYFKCKKCGAIRKNKAAEDDNMDLIINLSVKK